MSIRIPKLSHIVCVVCGLVLCSSVLTSCGGQPAGERMGSLLYDLKYTVRAIRNELFRESDEADDQVVLIDAPDRKSPLSTPPNPQETGPQQPQEAGPRQPQPQQPQSQQPQPLVDAAAADRLFIVARDSVVLSERTAALIVVDKGKMTLTVLDFRSDTLLNCPMGCGREYGDKRQEKDDRTPEGVFMVRRVENSVGWAHRASDGLVHKDAYGPRFIRLEYPPRHAIGIHGTDEPSTIGLRASEGCIRISNKNVRTLASIAYPGMPVIILPSPLDVAENQKITIAN